MKLLKNRTFWIVLASIAILVLATGLYAYNRITGTQASYTGYIYLRKTDTYDSVVKKLTTQGIVKDTKLFSFLANKANLPQHVHPGKYKLNNLTYIELIKLLRSGKQEEVKVVINGMTDTRKLAAIVAQQIDADSIQLVNMMEDTAYLSQLGFTKATALCLFIPNTYNFYWNSTADDFMKRMKKEYEKFWNDDQKRKALSVGLTPQEVGTLASIVDGETNKVDEMGIIAGLYLNRIKKGIPLQSDPTVKFAHNKSAMQRISLADTKIEHPYNTYYIQGLPPGPIALPTKQAIMAVLNPAQHNYIYMCAKEDLSGYHNFTHSDQQHVLNARRYHMALDRLGIK